MIERAQPEQDNQDRLLWIGFEKFFDRVTPSLFARFEDELAQAFQKVGYTAGGRIPSSSAVETMRRRRTKVSCGLSLAFSL
jgi:hypothetical protein